MKGEGREFLELLEEVADAEDLPDLLAACCGRRLYVPNQCLRADSWIVAAIGREKAEVLIKRLDLAGWRGSEIDIPFDGGGMVRAFRQATKNRIANGVRAGKSNAVIAAEIGITRRAVVMSKARMRKLGELPEVDPAAALRTRYLGPSLANTPAPPKMDASFWDGPSKDSDEAAGAPSNGPTPPDLNDLLPDDASARDQVIALMKRECGEAETARILDLAGSRALSLGPSAVRSVKHPFSVVLGAEKAGTLAIKIVATVPAAEMIRLKDRPDQLKPISERIRERLLNRILPQRIAADLNVPVAKVYSQAAALRKAGLLPPARGGRKLRGY